MKKETEAPESRLQSIGDWVKGASFVFMFAAVVAGILDLFIVTPNALTVPVWGYLMVIGTGVALQCAAAAIPNMKFCCRSKQPKTAELHRIDS